MNHVHNNPLQRGITLIELLIASALGMLIILTVTGLVIAGKSAQSTQIDADTVHDTGRYALENISRAIRQAGYVNYDQTDAPFFTANNIKSATPNLIGLDSASLTAKTHGIDAPIASSYNGSDVLAVRFAGSGTPKADGTVQNCAGSAIAAARANSTPQNDRGWSIYYVAKDVDDEPALFCKFNVSPNADSTDEQDKFSAQAIARGVESFQVLYQLSSPSKETNQFANASQINAMDAQLPPAEVHEKSHWRNVTSVKVALLIRSAENTKPNSIDTTYNLFGTEYSHMAGTDKGTQVSERNMPKHKRRFRKIVSATIHLRNLPT